MNQKSLLVLGAMEANLSMPMFLRGILVLGEPYLAIAQRLNSKTIGSTG